MNYFNQPLREIRSSLLSNKVSSTQLVEQALNAIDKENQNINAFVRVHREQAIKEAKAWDQKGFQDDKQPLAGIPIAIKDNLALKGSEVTASSRILQGFKCPYTASAVQKLLDAGAILIAQANMDEFAMGSSTEHSFYGATKNPWDLNRVPGGSSGGSAAAVAANFVPVALGSDTGGSIRQPASFCGVTGLKPTYGRVSRYGLFAYGSSLDQIGPITQHVEDAALLLKIIEGKDPKDSTTCDPSIPISDLQAEINGLKIGVPKEFMNTDKGLRPEVANLLQTTISNLEQLGAKVYDISLPILDYVIPTYYLIANSEASSNLARYDSIRYGFRKEEVSDLESSYRETRQEGFGNEVKTRIMLGTYALSAGYYDAYYKKAEAIRCDMRHTLTQIFNEVDVIVSPTTPDIAFKIGEKTDDPMSMYMQDLYTTFVNLVSNPAMSVPCGTVDGLPVGMQMVGKMFDENTLFRLGLEIEKVRNWTRLHD